MTMPAEGYTEEGPQNYYESHAWEAEPLGNLEPKQHTRRVPEFSSCMTWVIPQAGVGQPVQVLQRQPQRFKAKIVVQALATAQTEVVGANPAAGTDFIYTNTTSSPQTLVSIAATLTTSAVVANRFFNVQIRDTSGNIVYQQTDFAAVVASTSLAAWYAQGMPNTSNNAAGTTLGGLGNVLIQPGWTVRIHIVAMDAGDQLSNIFLVIGNSAGSVGVIFNSKLDPVQGSNPQGFTVNSTGALPDWESQQPLYAIATGGGAVLSIWDETFAVR